MLHYINEPLAEKLNELVPSTKELVHQSEVAEIFKKLLTHVDYRNLKIRNGILILEPVVTLEDRHRYTPKERAAVVEEVKSEIKMFFGVEADVEFWIDKTTEEEPDPIPPLYWGELESVYHYKCRIKIDLK